MTKFNVGDTVVATGEAWVVLKGELGKVIALQDGRPERPLVAFARGEPSWLAWGEYAVELVEAADVAQEETNEASDAINPPRSSPTYQIVAESDFEDEVWQVLIPLGKLIISKNKQYGDAALNPRNIFSKLAPGEGIKLRMDDKLSRIERGDGTGDEDAVADLAGYLVLLKIAERRAGQ